MTVEIARIVRNLELGTKGGLLFAQLRHQDLLLRPQLPDLLVQSACSLPPREREMLLEIRVVARLLSGAAFLVGFDVLRIG